MIIYATDVPAKLIAWRSLEPLHSEKYVVVLRNTLQSIEVVNSIAEQTGLPLNSRYIRYYYQTGDIIVLAVGEETGDEVTTLNLRLHRDEQKPLLDS